MGKGEESPLRDPGSEFCLGRKKDETRCGDNKPGNRKKGLFSAGPKNSCARCPTILLSIYIRCIPSFLQLISHDLAFRDGIHQGGGGHVWRESWLVISFVFYADKKVGAPFAGRVIFRKSGRIRGVRPDP